MKCGLPASSFVLLVATVALAPAQEKSASTPAYPSANLLSEAAELMKNPLMSIYDVRGKEQYAEGHIPGAVWIDAKAWERAFTAAPGVDAWSKRLGEAGIDPQQTVVLYGDDDVRTPARLWWILRYWGVKDVRLLNGGWSAWKEADGPVSTEDTKPQPKTVKLTAETNRLATKSQLLEALKDKPPQIIDARSNDEYCGTARTAKRNGSIPGAVHLEWTEGLDKKSKKFKSSEDLAQLLKEQKIDVNQPAVTYCQSGGRAAVVAFTLELMGGKQVKNYYRSWAEWGNAADTPVVKPSREHHAQ